MSLPCVLTYIKQSTANDRENETSVNFLNASSSKSLSEFLSDGCDSTGQKIMSIGPTLSYIKF